MSAPFKKIKGNSIGDKVRYSRMILFFSCGMEYIVTVAEIKPQTGYYEYPILIKEKDFK